MARIGSSYVGGCDLGSSMLLGSSGVDASSTLPGGSSDVHYATGVGIGGGGKRPPNVPVSGGNGLIIVLGDIPTAYLQNFQTPGTFSWAVPVEWIAVKVKLWGAGGAGGGAGGTSNAGGSGGFTECRMSVLPGQMLTFIVGAGGTNRGYRQSSPGGH